MRYNIFHPTYLRPILRYIIFLGGTIALVTLYITSVIQTVKTFDNLDLMETMEVNIQDFLQVFQGSGIGKMEVNEC